MVLARGSPQAAKGAFEDIHCGGMDRCTNARWSSALNESRTSGELRHGVTVAHAVSLKNDACREKAGSKKGLQGCPTFD